MKHVLKLLILNTNQVFEKEHLSGMLLRKSALVSSRSVDHFCASK